MIKLSFSQNSKFSFKRTNERKLRSRKNTEKKEIPQFRTIVPKGLRHIIITDTVQFLIVQSTDKKLFTRHVIERDQLSVSGDLPEQFLFRARKNFHVVVIVKRCNVINGRGTIYRWGRYLPGGRGKMESNEFSGIGDHRPLLTYG